MTDYYANKEDIIDTDLWVEILKNTDVVNDKVYEIMEILINSSEYRALAGSDIAPLMGYNGHGPVNKLVSGFSKRILKEYPSIEPPRYNGKPVYWNMPFHERKADRIYWILRPELAEALPIAYPEILDKKRLSIEQDETYLRQAAQDAFLSIENGSRSLEKTTRDAFVKQRIGQSKFREYLSTYWQGCSVTGCKQIEILIASHIQPWSESDSQERIDKFNGLLLTPNLDKCFDNYLISFENDGPIIISDKLTDATRSILGITPDLSLRRIASQHEKYLKYHRDKFYST